MICKKCGNELNEKSNHCNNCGYNNSIVKKILFIISTIIFLILIAFVAFRIFDNHIFKSRTFTECLNPNMGGIGVVISTNNKEQVVINRVIPKLPADKSGILANDIIVSVNNRKVKNNIQASNLMKGKPGSSVKILIKRNNKLEKYRIIRANILEKPGFYPLYYNLYLRQDYLKYDNGKYYFWVVQLPGSYGFPPNKKIAYIKAFYSIDVINQKIALIESFAYDVNNQILYQNTTRQEDIEFDNIVPDTVGYYFYQFIKNLDETIPTRYKKKLKGFFN